jgi:thiol peroxidase
MAQITLKGNPVNTAGTLPAVGSKIKDFNLVAGDLSSKSLADFPGKLVLNIFPSLDTGTCALSVKRFNKIASEREDYTVLCISRDLPFAQGRFCGAEGLDKVVTLSDFRTGAFGSDYELEITDGPLRGLLSRCVIIVDEKGEVKYTEQVAEVTEEPNYDAAIAAL